MPAHCKVLHGFEGLSSLPGTPSHDMYDNCCGPRRQFLSIATEERPMSSYDINPSPYTIVATAQLVLEIFFTMSVILESYIICELSSKLCSDGNQILFQHFDDQTERLHCVHPSLHRDE